MPLSGNTYGGIVPHAYSRSAVETFVVVKKKGGLVRCLVDATESCVCLTDDRAMYLTSVFDRDVVGRTFWEISSARLFPRYQH